MFLSPVITALLTLFLSSVNGTFHENYTYEELQALEQFRPIGLKLVNNGYEKEDIYLIHWLRAQNLKISDASEMLKKTMLWRKAEQVDTVLQNKELIAANERFFPISYGISKDKEGRPAELVAYANFDFRRSVVQGFTFHKLVTYNLEKMSSIAFLSNYSQYIVLIDMNQFNIRQHGCFSCLSYYVEYLTLYETYYPNMAKLHYIINVPRIFTSVFVLVRGLLSPHTSKNLKMFGVNKQEWQPKVHQLFDASQLPIRFGGTKRGSYLN